METGPMSLALELEGNDHESRIWGEYSSGRGRETDLPLEPLEGARPCQHLDFGLMLDS